MVEIQVLNADDENLFNYASEIIPRKGELLQVQGKENILKVIDIEHYLRPHGSTGQLVSPCVRIVVECKK